MRLPENWLVYLVRLISILAILPVHECAHAWTACRLGDPTARERGRLTLNPFRHLDPIGAICLLALGFGWAKPVPIDARRFRDPKTGMALSSLAGPVSNLLLALVVMSIGKVFYGFYALGDMQNITLFNIFYVLGLMAQISTALAVFNLLPVPPLDGSRILLLFLPRKAYFGLMKYERYIALGLTALLLFGLLDKPLSWLTDAFFALLDWMTGWIFLLFGV